MPADEKNKEVTKRLDIIIALLLDLLDRGEEKEPQMVLVKRLRRLGLENKDIAPILGKTSGQVGRLLYETKRKKKKRG